MEPLQIERETNGTAYVYCLNFWGKMNHRPGIYLSLEAAQAHAEKHGPVQWRDFQGFEGVCWISIDKTWIIDKMPIMDFQA